MKRWSLCLLTLFSVFWLVQFSHATQEGLTLETALNQALSKSNIIKLAQAKIAEKELLTDQMESKQFPKIVVGGFAAYNTNPIDSRIQAGDFDYLLSSHGGASGPLSFLSPLPSSDITLARGSEWPYVVHGTIIQPLSMLPLIRTGGNAAAIETDIAKVEVEDICATIRYDVEQCYCGIIVADARIKAVQADIISITSQAGHAVDGVEVGEELTLTLSGLQVQVTKARLELEQEKSTRTRLYYLLKMLTGSPIDAQVVIDVRLPLEPVRQTAREYLQAAMNNNSRFIKTGYQVSLAEQGVKAVAQGNYPDVFAFGSIIHQEGTPLIEENFGLFGIGASWDIIDFGTSDAERAMNLQKKIQAQEMQEKVRRNLNVKSSPG